MSDQDYRDHFKSVLDLIREKNDITIGMIASVIEQDDAEIYTWDQYGRFRKAEQKGASCSIEHVLSELAKHHKWIEETYLDPGAEAALDYFLHDEASDRYSLNQYGWPENDLPEFAKVHEHWLKTNLGEGTPEIKAPKALNPNAGKQKALISGLLAIAAGASTNKSASDIIKDLNSKKSKYISPISTKLQNLGFDVSTKVIRLYIEAQIGKGNLVEPTQNK